MRRPRREVIICADIASERVVPSQDGIDNSRVSKLANNLHGLFDDTKICGFDSATLLWSVSTQNTSKEKRFRYLSHFTCRVSRFGLKLCQAVLEPSKIVFKNQVLVGQFFMAFLRRS